MEKSDYRRQPPLNVSVTAKCTVKQKAKVLSDGSQSLTIAKFRNSTAPPQTPPSTPREGVKKVELKGLVHYLKDELSFVLCAQGMNSFLARAKPFLLYR